MNRVGAPPVGPGEVSYGLRPDGTPIGTVASTAPPAKPLTSPWSFHLEIVDGKNHITAKAGKTVQFSVVCDKVEIQSPVGSILASGNVNITSQSLEASCNRLIIAFESEVVALTGGVHMKCQNDGQELDLRSELFSLKLSEMQRPTPVAPRTSVEPGSSVRPPVVTAQP